MVAAMAATHCDWSDDRVAESFTPDQWAKLQADYAPPGAPTACPPHVQGQWSAAKCQAAARLGQQLFFETRLSSNCTVSCATCHDPDRWFIDSRTASNVSSGAITFTGRNAISLVNGGLKDDLAPQDQHEVFTWGGHYTSPGSVLRLAAGKPMGNEDVEAAVDKVIRSPTYWATYMGVFGVTDSQSSVLANIELAFDAYIRQLSSLDAPFDRFITGRADAIGEDAQRGFGLFVGKAMCAECHRGPLFSDFRFHATGVPQAGANVPATDSGRQKWTMQPADTGTFLTPTLRNATRTAPYMHDGWMANLAEVIAFYRAGGGSVAAPGTLDLLMEPLDLSDQDVTSLEAFLATLDGAPVPETWTQDTHVKAPCSVAR